MGLLRAPSRSAGTAIWFITVGVLMMIWTGVWYYSMWGVEGTPEGRKYICAGLFFSGLAVAVIGLMIGQIGRAAKRADNTVGTVPTNSPVAPAVVAPPVTAQQPPQLADPQFGNVAR